MKLIPLLSALLLLALPACSGHGGGAGSVGETRAETTTVDLRRSTPTLRLGHYSTQDALDGFVLDRLAQPWLIRRDGTDDVLRLERSNQGVDWLDFEAGELWLRVYTSGRNGGRVLFDGPMHGEGVDAYRDADAEPLR